MQQASSIHSSIISQGESYYQIDSQDQTEKQITANLIQHQQQLQSIQHHLSQLIEVDYCYAIISNKNPVQYQYIQQNMLLDRQIEQEINQQKDIIQQSREVELEIANISNQIQAMKRAKGVVASVDESKEIKEVKQEGVQAEKRKQKTQEKISIQIDKTKLVEEIRKKNECDNQTVGLYELEIRREMKKIEEIQRKTAELQSKTNTMNQTVQYDNRELLTKRRQTLEDTITKLKLNLNSSQIN